MDSNVSVFLPTFEDFETIKGTFFSAILQSKRAKNIVLVVNAGTERYIRFLEILVADYENVYLELFSDYVCAEENFNRAIELAKEPRYKSNYFAIFHADDIYDYHYLNTMTEYAIRSPDVAVLFSQSIHVDSELNFLRYQYNRHLNSNTMLVNRNTFIDLLCVHGNIFHCPSVFISASKIGDERFQPGEYGRSADLFLWWRMASKNDILLINKNLTFYRFAGSSYSYNQAINKMHSGDGLKAYRGVLKDLDRIGDSRDQVIRLKKALISEKILEVSLILKCGLINRNKKNRYRKLLRKLLINFIISNFLFSYRRAKIFIFGAFIYLRY